MPALKLQALRLPVCITGYVPSNFPRKNKIFVIIVGNSITRRLLYCQSSSSVGPITNATNGRYERRDLKSPYIPTHQLSIFSFKAAIRKWKKTAAKVKKENAIAITENRKIKYVLMSIDYYETLTQSLRKDSL
jgi:hypothetical protein